MRGPGGVRRGPSLSDLSVIEDGSLLIRDGRIEEVGKSRRIENLRSAKGALEIPVHGKVVLPGFVDPSIRIGAAEIAPGQSSPRKIAPGKFVDETRTLLRGCLHHGTTAAELKVRNHAGVAADLSLLRHLGRMNASSITIARTWRLRLSEETQGRELAQAIEVLRKRGLARFIELECDERHIALAAGVFAMAQRSGIAGKLSWEGNSAEGAVRLAAESAPRTIRGLTHLNQREMEALAGIPVTLVLEPNQELLSSAADTSFARRQIDAGVAVALATGHGAQNAIGFSMQMAIILAVLRLQLTIEEAITCATVNAAHAAGLGNAAGSLEADKAADIVILNLPDYREIPHQIGINHVGMVIQNGNVVFNRTKWRVAGR